MIKSFLHIQINTKRIYGLDILRAWAILFVVIGHGRHLLPSSLDFFHELIVYDGVSIFFVLSGFLIGGILIKILNNQKANWNTLWNFWIRRWFRTLPNYFLILLILLLLRVSTIGMEKIDQIIPYFYFSQNLFYNHPSFFFPEAWSLSVEEWFYLSIPPMIVLLIAIFKRSPNQSILLVALMVLIGSILYRYFSFTSMSEIELRDWDLVFRKQVLSRLDSLMIGVIGALIQFDYPKIWLKRKKTLLIIGIMIFLMSKVAYLNEWIDVGGIFNCVFYFTVIALSTLLLFPYLSSLKEGKGWLFRSFTTISLISYSMYLVNYSLIQGYLLKFIPWDLLGLSSDLLFLFKYLTYWGLTIIISIVLYKHFEIPTTSLRDKLGSLRHSK